MWTTEEAQRALSLCDDPILLLAMLLALGCSMRIGEILGLTWDCVDISESSTADGTACVLVNKELKRCDKTSLADLQRRGRSDVWFVFPERKQAASSTSLVLKEPKTASSVRKVFLPKTVRACLKSSNKNGNEGKSKKLSRNKEFAFTIFPKPAEFVEPAKKTLYHPTARQHNKLV